MLRTFHLQTMSGSALNIRESYLPQRVLLTIDDGNKKITATLTRDAFDELTSLNGYGANCITWLDETDEDSTT